MAHSKELWKKAKALFELGKSLDYIAEETNISKGQVSKKATAMKWSKGKMKPIKDDIVAFEKEKETIFAKKETILQKVSFLDDFEITIMDNLIQEEENIKTLLTSTATLAIVRNNEKLTENKKTVMLKTIDYDDKGFKSGETWKEHNIELSTSDIKDIVDSTDKASLTLGVNQRHANNTINNTNAVQTKQDTTINIIRDN